MSSLAVLILFHERPGQTIQCVESFLPSGVPIHVLDNGSSAEASEALVRRFEGEPTVRIEHAGENIRALAGKPLSISTTCCRASPLAARSTYARCACCRRF